VHRKKWPRASPRGTRSRPPPPSRKGPHAWRAVYAARRFTLLSAMAVSFLSTAFSSSRFC
jgi:hypothetical protein